KDKDPEDTLEWTPEAEAAFVATKEALANATLLKYPIPGAKLSIWVDASDLAVGGALMQLVEKEWQPLCFYSMKLKPNQRKWSAYDRELFAAYSSVRTFRHMVEG